MDKKVHYKMHKVKKQWVTIAVTGMSLGAVSAVSLGTNDGVVQADEHTDATVAIPDITVDTGTVSNDTTAAQDPTTAVAATNDVATDQAAPTATFDLTTDTTNTVAANAVDTASCNIHLDKQLSSYYDKICIKSTRAVAQLGRAPRLHERQCFFFRGVHLVIKKVYLKKSVSYSILRNKTREH